MFESEDGPPSKVPLSLGDVEGVPLPEAEVGIGRPPAEVMSTVLRDEPSSSRMDDVPSSTEGRDKGAAEDKYKTGSDIDVEEVRMLSEGFMWVEVRLEGASRTIMVPMDRDLLVNTEDVLPSLGPHCSDVEGRTLEKLDDDALSMGIAGLALKVKFLFLTF